MNLFLVSPLAFETLILQYINTATDNRMRMTARISPTHSHASVDIEMNSYYTMFTIKIFCEISYTTDMITLNIWTSN